MRTLVIGDLHSGLKALQQVLLRAKVSPSDHLIFLGDYVDGWSDAVNTVNFLMELRLTHNCSFIRGNHDELCNDWLKSGDHNPVWLQHGGSATQNSYRLVGDDIKEAHIEFYVGHEYFTKTYYWDRTLWELALSLDPSLTKEDEFYPQRLTHYKEIFIGHTPVTRIGRTTPKNAANIWNVDTGAAFRGPLTIMDVASKQYWQSDPVYLFYPSETGRN